MKKAATALAGKPSLANLEKFANESKLFDVSRSIKKQSTLDENFAKWADFPYIRGQKRMNTLLIAATEGEVGPFLRLPEWQRAGTDVLITGAGMVATAFALGNKLATAHYDLILNVGIAGSFDRSIPLGEVVCIYRDTFAELGAEDGGDFLDSEQLGLGRHTFEGIRQGYPALNGLLKCQGITVNKVHGNAVTISEIVRRLNPQTESMEGAAVFYVADQLGIPAMQVRAVSNYVERRNKAGWEIPRAIENLNGWIQAFFNP